MKTVTQICLFFFFVILSLNILESQESWQRLESPTTKWLYRCTYTDSNHVWAAGDSGVIVHTSNAGATWVLQNSGINNFIEDIFFLNPRLGWAISNDYLTNGTTILKTTNGGNNWSVTYFPDSSLILYTVYFLDSLNGFLGGLSGTILKTTNAGNSWVRCEMGPSFFALFPIRKFSFLNQQYGLACGGIIDIAGLIWRTTDYGYNWSQVDTTPEPVNDVYYYSSNRTFATGGDFEYGASFAYSNTGGASWIDSTLGIFGAGQSVAIRTLREIWVPLGFSQNWMVSQDTGKTWVSIPASDSTAVYDAIFIDPLRGWAFGANGGIFKFNPLFSIGIENNQIPVSAKLYQNYPNPFNPSTTISYQVLRASKVKITLFDMIGREVKVILNDYKYPGNYQLKINSDGLSSGVYFYKLESAGFVETKKMVIVK